jgi:hypothetical protein
MFDNPETFIEKSGQRRGGESWMLSCERFSLSKNENVSKLEVLNVNGYQRELFNLKIGYQREDIGVQTAIAGPEMAKFHGRYRACGLWCRRNENITMRRRTQKTNEQTFGF